MLAAAIIVVLAAVVFGVLYVRFINTPAGKWKQQYKSHVADLQQQKARNEAAIAAAASRITAHGQELYSRQIRKLSPEVLADYPGIGPVTVERLLNAGLRSIPEVDRYDLQQIGGIGPVKAKVIREAVRKVLADAQSRFDAGASSEGQEFRRWQSSPELVAVRIQRESYQKFSLAVSAALEQSKVLAHYAGKVTFWRYLCGQAAESLPEEIRLQPLPALQPHYTASPPSPAVVPVPPPPPAASVPVAKPSPAPVVLPPIPPPPTPTVPPPPTPPRDIFMESPTAAPPAAPPVVPGLDQLRAVCRFGLAVARADGRLAQAERKAIRGFAAEQFGHDQRLLRHIDPTLEESEKSIPGIEEAIEQVAAFWQPGNRAVLYHFAEAVTDATGGERSARENDLLARLAAKLGVLTASAAPPPSGPAQAPAAQKTVPATTTAPTSAGEASPRAILEIAPDDELSPELIRRRYLLLTEKANPSRAATLGQDFAEMAERKRLALRSAAETLIAPFGVPLDLPAAPPPPTDIRHNPDLDDVFGR